MEGALPDVDSVLGPGSPLSQRMEGYEHREGQLAMARAVYEAFTDDRHLLVEAGTGTGKTLAYLIPAVLSGRRVVVATATHALQEQIFTKDLPLVRDVLAAHGVTFKAALMKGLSNYLCKRRAAERFGSGETMTQELVRIERWARETETGERSELEGLAENANGWRDVMSGTDTRVGAGCKYYDECFVTNMRREAESAQIVVVNHHLFFADLALRTGKNGGYGGALPPYDAVVFDEAHQIEGVATDFFGVRVSTSRLETLVRDARRAIFAAKLLDSSSMRLVDDLDAAAHAFFRSWQGAGRPAAARGGPASWRGAAASDDGKRILAHGDWTPARLDALGRLDLALEALHAFALGHDTNETIGVIARRAGDLLSDLGRVRGSAGPERHWEEDDPTAGALARAAQGYAGGVAWLDARERSVSLGASPVDLSPLLREKLFERIPSVICTSATLATATSAGPSFHFARARLGAPAETGELVVPSPFAFEERAALYIPDDLPEPTDARFEQACAERAAELAEITDGGCFVLCTSNRAMRAIHAALVQRFHGSYDPAPPAPLLLQGEAPKHVLLERFRASGRAMLVATMSFWEGVDVPGHALRLVVLDKIPFAVPSDPIVAARSARIEAEGGNPFTEYAVPTAAITLKQGFGRLIRTRSDGGIVALLDRRAVRRGYGRSLLASLPPAQRLEHIEEVRSFWQSL